MFRRLKRQSKQLKCDQWKVSVRWIREHHGEAAVKPLAGKSVDSRHVYCLKLHMPCRGNACSSLQPWPEQGRRSLSEKLVLRHARSLTTTCVLLDNFAKVTISLLPALQTELVAAWLVAVGITFSSLLARGHGTCLMGPWSADVAAQCPNLSVRGSLLQHCC